MNTQEEKKENAEEKERELEQAIREKTFSYIVAAFGLVAGLAWNEAIKAFIEFVFPKAGNSLMAKFVYALVLTIVVVYVSVYLGKLFKKEENNRTDSIK